MVSVVSTIVAPNPHRRMLGKFIAASTPMQNEREVVVITGASAGVGRATARAFGRRGARVALIARGRDGLEAAKREIESFGGEALVLPLDVSDPEAVEQAAATVEQQFDRSISGSTTRWCRSSRRSWR